MSEYKVGYGSLNPYFGGFNKDITGDTFFDIQGKMGSPVSYLEVRATQNCHLHLNFIVENLPVDTDGFYLLSSIDLEAGRVYRVDEGFPIKSVDIHYSGVSVNNIKMFFK